MDQVIAEWAGKERVFQLGFGGVLDLEEACGKEAIGAIFLRLSTGKFRVHDVYHTIRLALIGGGENLLEVKRLLNTHFDRIPLMENAALAGDILIALMTGVEASEDSASGDRNQEPAPWKFSEVSQICRTFHLSPADLRAMRYADLINMVRGFNAASGERKAEPPTEEEFIAILEKYEPEALSRDSDH